MVQECVDSYRVSDKEDEGVEIVIRVPRRFKNLWLVRLSQLSTSEEEIREFEDSVGAV
jgi:hypothetical protein